MLIEVRFYKQLLTNTFYYMKVIPLHHEEQKLIQLAIENNRQAQQQLYSKFSSKMLGVCRQYIKDIHQAEDVMITAFMKVFVNLRNFENKGSSRRLDTQNSWSMNVFLF